MPTDKQESVADFKARLAAKLGTTPVPKKRDNSLLVRQPGDKGYDPPRPSVETIARRLRCTPEQVREQMRRNAKQLREMAVKAGDGKINGYTAEQLNKNAEEFETMGKETNE